jgi:Flp pilus assembly protein TadG
MSDLLARLGRLSGRLLRARDGGIAPLFALSAFAIMVSVGFGVDYSRALNTQASLQAALDAAALSAVTTQAGNRSNVGTTMLQAAFPAASVSWTNNSDGSLTGTATTSFPTTLMGIAGVTSLNLAARATAVPGSATNKVCFLVLDPSASQSLLVNSGVTLQAPACEIDVASTGSPAAIFNSSSTLNLASICVAGTSVIQNGGPVPGLKTGCSTAPDPFAGTLPSASTSPCTVNGGTATGYNTLVPGVYCGSFNLNGTGTLNLQPGLYVLSNARLNVNSGWTVQGTGVTFYFADASSYIQINSGASLKVTAPTSGTYADILMYEPPGLAKSSFTIDGGSGQTLSGLVYLPSRNITFNAMSSATAETTTFVVNQLILDSMNWTVSSASTRSIASSGGSGGGTATLAR